MPQDTFDFVVFCICVDFVITSFSQYTLVPAVLIMVFDLQEFTESIPRAKEVCTISPTNDDSDSRK